MSSIKNHLQRLEWLKEWMPLWIDLQELKAISPFFYEMTDVSMSANGKKYPVKTFDQYCKYKASIQSPAEKQP